MKHKYDDYGWYIGTGTGQRTTDTAPANTSTDDTEGQPRSNWTGYEWIELPYVKPPEPTITQDMVDAKLAAINEGKNTALDGGFTHDGKLYDSDSKARLAYLELSLKFGQEPTYSTPWKASTGVWVMMTAALFAALQPAYEAHIAGCFAWQRFREAAVAAAVAAGDAEALAEVAERM